MAWDSYLFNQVCRHTRCLRCVGAALVTAPRTHEACPYST
jgi:hypothetical protein